MIRRFCKDLFVENYKKTIGVDFQEKSLSNKDGKSEIRLMVWDTAGQEDFNAITRSYYRGSHAAVFVFSTNDRGSLAAVRNWKKVVDEECPGVFSVLVQNKVDLLVKEPSNPSYVTP